MVRSVLYFISNYLGDADGIRLVNPVRNELTNMRFVFPYTCLPIVCLLI